MTRAYNGTPPGVDLAKVKARAQKLAPNMAWRAIANALRSLPFERAQDELIREFDAKWVVIKHVGQFMGKAGPRSKPRWRRNLDVPKGFEGKSVQDQITATRARALARGIATQTVNRAIATLPFEGEDYITENEARKRTLDHFAKVMGEGNALAKNRFMQGVGEAMTTPTTSRTRLRDKYGHEPEF